METDSNSNPQTAVEPTGLVGWRHLLLMITGRTPREWYDNDGYLRPGWEWAPNGDFNTLTITCQHAPNFLRRILAWVVSGSKYRVLVPRKPTVEADSSAEAD